MFCRLQKRMLKIIVLFFIIIKKLYGQLVNIDKSKQIYSKRVPEDFKIICHDWLPIKIVHMFSKYLGLPSNIGRSNKVDFDVLKDRIWKSYTIEKKSTLFFMKMHYYKSSGSINLHLHFELFYSF